MRLRVSLAALVFLGVLLSACARGGTAISATAAPARSSTLTTQGVIDGFNAAGTVRVPDTGAKTTTLKSGVEETTELLYVGPASANVVATGYLSVAPAGTDMAGLRAAREAELAKSSTNKVYTVQDRNVLLFLAFASSTNPEADRATVEAALKAIP